MFPSFSGPNRASDDVKFDRSVFFSLCNIYQLAQISQPQDNFTMFILNAKTVRKVLNCLFLLL